VNDVSLLRDHVDVLADGLRRRGIDIDLEALRDLDERRRAVRTSAEETRARQKEAGKEIARLQGDAKSAAIAETALMADRYKEQLTEADRLDGEFDSIWIPLPNPPHESVPVGATDADNVEIKTWGTPRQFDFEIQDHVDIGERLGLLDIERAAKVSGSRFAYLKGQAVMLEFALVQWALGRLAGEGFTPVVPPVLVRESALFGTGFLPGARDQAYAVGWNDGKTLESDELFLAATAEIPLASMFADEILDASDLPMRFAGFSTCFRREAGTYGKDTRGIFRVHQFDKVEMFSFANPATSWDEHEFLLSIEEGLVRDLGLPYRVVNVCTGDLGDPAAKKYDIEAWFPGQGAYREITSCSNTTDYQARRLRIRVRDGEGPTTIAHTLNGTAVAIGRTLIALLENHQQADGSVLIPEPLRGLMGTDRIGP
jgi:seryl-tRNA synthetase